MGTLIVVAVGVALLAALLFLALRLFLSPMIVIRPTVAGPGYLGQGENDAGELYEAHPDLPRDSLVIPFSSVIADTLEGMCVIHFSEKDGIHYLGLEPQVFRLRDGSTYKRLLATTERRTDADLLVPRGALDVEKRLNRVTLPVGDVRDTLETDFERFELSITDKGLLVDVACTDRYDRKLHIQIDEQQLGRQVAYRSMLAPASLASHSHYFPLLFLSKMAIAHRRSAVNVTIDGQRKELLKIPVLGVDLIIYSRDLPAYLLFLTEKRKSLRVHNDVPDGGKVGLAQPNYEPENSEHFEEDDTVQCSFNVRRNQGFSEISRAEYSYAGHHIHIDFVPHLPALVHLREGARMAGKFSISADATLGVIAGSYRVHREGSRVVLSMQMEDAYQPVEGDRWVRAYRWEAVVSLDEDGPWLSARWHKKQIRNDGLHVKIVQ